MVSKDKPTAFPVAFRGTGGLMRTLQLTRENRIANLILFAILLCTVSLFRVPLTAAAHLSFEDDRYFQVVVGPILCLFLIYRERAGIFANARFSPRLGFPALFFTLLVSFVLLPRTEPNGAGSLLPAILAFVMVWVAAFILCYGIQSLKAALFPLCCLLMMIPLPPAWLDDFAIGLEHGSADVSYVLFRLAGIPVFWHGMTFSLPGLDVAVEPECSGIRGCMVFVLLGILASRVFLRSGWRRWILIIMMIPIAIAKNAVRIVVISTLSAYVNRAFLFGNLHHYGGLVFLVVGIGLFLPLLSALQKSEIRSLCSGTLLD